MTVSVVAEPCGTEPALWTRPDGISVGSSSRPPGICLGPRRPLTCPPQEAPSPPTSVL